MESIRCPHCEALLLRAAIGAIQGNVEIKCRRCRTFVILRAMSPAPERPGAPCTETCP
ncbi:MAG: Com family DNA-binding transcriptional regulator [Magnetospirillum sp.]|nr:Com family DNA-binding transcriptional regulator [Magnetospirillum sp.]